jgi:hypothetical protein
MTVKLPAHRAGLPVRIPVNSKRIKITPRKFNGVFYCMENYILGPQISIGKH